MKRRNFTKALLAIAAVPTALAVKPGRAKYELYLRDVKLQLDIDYFESFFTEGGDNKLVITFSDNILGDALNGNIRIKYLSGDNAGTSEYLSSYPGLE